VNCHLQELPENGADAVHFGLVHKLPMLPESPIRNWNWSIEHSLAGKWVPCDEEGRKHTANIHVTHHVTMFNLVSFGYLDFFATQIGPGISHIHFANPFGRGVIIQNVTPLGPLDQLLTQRFYTSATFITPGVKVIMAGQSIMISRDITIWNRKTYKKNPPLAKEDNALKRFRIWYSQFYSENSPRYFSKNDASDKSMIALRSCKIA
jgi:cholesterol 7-dehydrogenase